MFKIRKENQDLPDCTKNLELITNRFNLKLHAIIFVENIKYNSNAKTKQYYQTRVYLITKEK